MALIIYLNRREKNCEEKLRLSRLAMERQENGRRKMYVVYSAECEKSVQKKSSQCQNERAEQSAKDAGIERRGEGSGGWSHAEDERKGQICSRECSVSMARSARDPSMKNVHSHETNEQNNEADSGDSDKKYDK